MTEKAQEELDHECCENNLDSIMNDKSNYIDTLAMVP